MYMYKFSQIDFPSILGIWPHCKEVCSDAVETTWNNQKWAAKYSEINRNQAESHDPGMLVT